MVNDRAWIYCKINSEDDLNDLEGQKELLTAFAEYEGYRVAGLSQNISSVDVLDENGVSTLVQIIGDEMIDTVFVTDSFRLGVSIDEIYEVLTQLNNIGVQVISMNDGVLDTTQNTMDKIEKAMNI